MLYLILTENSFQFCGSNYLQIHETAMGTKMAIACANIFMARILEKQILSQSCIKPLFWKRYIDDVFSLWNTSLDKIESFVEKTNNFHSTIKFTTEMSETEIMFLDTKMCQGARFDLESILDVQTHFYSLQALPSLKRILMGKRHLIQNQQRLRAIFREPPLICYRKRESLKELLVRAKL